MTSKKYEGAPVTTLVMQTIEQVAMGMSNEQIAEQAGVPLNTAKSRVSAAMGALGATSRAELVGLAYREGYLSAGKPAEQRIKEQQRKIIAELEAEVAAGRDRAERLAVHARKLEALVSSLRAQLIAEQRIRRAEQEIYRAEKYGTGPAVPWLDTRQGRM